MSTTLRDLAGFIVDTAGKTELEIAKQLFDYAFDYAAETGITAALLSGHLSEKGRQYGEDATDLAEAAKLAVLEMQKAGLP